MKLSQVLEIYYVVVNSSVVGFCIPDAPDEIISITFQDDDGMDVDQYFMNQNIELLPFPKGGFTIIDIEEERLQFLALDGVDLRNPDGKS